MSWSLSHTASLMEVCVTICAVQHKSKENPMYTTYEKQFKEFENQWKQIRDYWIDVTIDFLTKLQK